MKPLVVRLSLSGSRSFPNILVRSSQIIRITRLSICSAILTSLAIGLDISPVRTSLLFMNISTLLLALGMLCSIFVVQERAAAVKTGVVESDIEQVKSIYPLLLLAPGLTVLFFAFNHIVHGYK